MKKIILGLLCLSIFTSSYAQKVQYKKDKILVNKKEQFKFIKTKDGNLIKGTFPHFAIKDLNGEEILTFTDKQLQAESFKWSQIIHQATKGIRFL